LRPWPALLSQPRPTSSPQQELSLPPSSVPQPVALEQARQPPELLPEPERLWAYVRAYRLLVVPVHPEQPARPTQRQPCHAHVAPQVAEAAEAVHRASGN